jgi:hypothetical protein
MFLFIKSIEDLFFFYFFFHKIAIRNKITRKKYKYLKLNKIVKNA